MICIYIYIFFNVATQLNPLNKVMISNAYYITKTQVHFCSLPLICFTCPPLKLLSFAFLRGSGARETWQAGTIYVSGAIHEKHTKKCVKTYMENEHRWYTHEDTLQNHGICFQWNGTSCRFHEYGRKGICFYALCPLLNIFIGEKTQVFPCYSQAVLGES